MKNSVEQFCESPKSQLRKSSQCGAGGEIYGPEHLALQDSLRKLIESDINPHVPQWEEIKQFPVKEVMKKFGEGGFLGASFPEEDGGMGLDYSYTVAIAETMGEIRCGAIPMGKLDFDEYF